MASLDFPAEISALRSTFASIEAVSDVDAIKRDIAELSQQATAPDLWDDQAAAQKITSKLSHKQSDLERLEKLGGRIDDIEVMVQLAAEEDDPETLELAVEELAAVKKALSRLEVQTLLSGEYDEREAVVTIRAGAGGVDAADFAEMLMRMYLRWAERHGYPTTVLDTSYAEEAGLKSATFEVKVPYAFSPSARKVADLMPASSPADTSSSSTLKPRVSPQRIIIRSTISAQSWASVPPAPALTVTSASPAS